MGSEHLDNMSCLAYNTAESIHAISELIMQTQWKDVNPKRVHGLGLILEDSANKIQLIAEYIDTIPAPDQEG